MAKLGLSFLRVALSGWLLGPQGKPPIFRLHYFDTVEQLLHLASRAHFRGVHALSFDGEV